MSAAVATSNRAQFTRTEVEDLLFREAELLDAWDLDGWLDLLTEDAMYLVPPNDLPDADHRYTLFIIADDMVRLKERIIRLKDPNCHAEYPHSRTRRLIGNVRVTDVDGDRATATANFIVYRHRRHETPRVFSGYYRYRLRRVGSEIRIAERRAVMDAEELGPLGGVSFIL
ncbi:MAG: aromatic-ring-hydroxylating dioxygenase subunit beta [Hyphomicrobiaceae bacterium]